MDKIILGIESSCDDTSVAIVKNGRKVLSNVLSSQIEIHKIFGGVVPEIASRKHVECIYFLLKESLYNAKVKLTDLSAVAVTYGPGLIGSLLVGLSFAKSLAYSSNLPLIGINHIEGHIASNYISNENLQPPFISLVISGGHTYLIKVIDYTKFKIYGETKDDACGEVFDKVARAMGLSYPGGPDIENYANMNNAVDLNFPRGNIKNNEYDFTFSGLKSHAINVIHNIKQKSKDNALSNKQIANISYSFQNSIIDTLVTKTINLTKKLKLNKIALCGGCSANNTIRKQFEIVCKNNNINFYAPELKYCTDNAAMIATVGYYKLLNNKIDNILLNAYANLSI